MSYPRVEYEMTVTQMNVILDACKPVPVLFGSGGVPFGGSQQQNANAAWERLGDVLGFDPMTVQPVAGKGIRFFTAVPKESEEARVTRLQAEADQRKRTRIEELQSEIESRRKELTTLTGDES